MYGSSRPSWRSRGATAGATAAPSSSGSSTIGRAADMSTSAAAASTSHSSAAASTDSTITANGLSSRCLRDLSRATAASADASAARWYPPSPLTATISPARNAAATSSIGRSSAGPHTGQHTGWAWNRRSPGSSYSARQSAHMTNDAIVVFGRS